MATGTYQNADGLLQKYPDYYKDRANFVNRPRTLNTMGHVKVLEIDFDLTKIADGATGYPSDLNNDGIKDGFTTGEVYLPAHSSILRCIVLSTETAIGGTSFTLGFYTLTGAAIDADGIVTATEGVTVNLLKGNRIYGNGAYVATTPGINSIGAADGYLAISCTGTFTAGKGKIYIEYIDPVVDAA